MAAARDVSFDTSRSIDEHAIDALRLHAHFVLAVPIIVSPFHRRTCAQSAPDQHAQVLGDLARPHFADGRADQLSSFIGNAELTPADVADDDAIPTHDQREIRQRVQGHRIDLAHGISVSWRVWPPGPTQDQLDGFSARHGGRAAVNQMFRRGGFGIGDDAIGQVFGRAAPAPADPGIAPGLGAIERGIGESQHVFPSQQAGRERTKG